MHAVYTRDASDNITLTVLGCCQIGGIQEKKNITFLNQHFLLLMYLQMMLCMLNKLRHMYY